MLFSVRVDDPDGLGRVVIRFNNSTASELLVCNCGGNTSESFTDAGIKPRDFNLGIGSHTAQLIANNGSERVVDTLRFSWNPPVIGNVEVDRTFGSFTVNWSPLPGYSVYNLYISSEPNISPDNADGLPNSVTFRSLRGTSQTISDIDDELGLFGLVTGTDTSGESAFSEVFRIEALDNLDPVVEPESFTLDEDTSATGNVLANDADPEEQPLEAELVNQPLSGTVDLSLNGAFIYEPNENFNGTDEFSYTANDPQGGSQLGVVSLTVTPINDAPTADNDTYQTNEDETLNIDSASGVLTNDLDIDGDQLSANVLTVPVDGTLSLNIDGSFNYEPNPEFFGTDSFTYQITDGNGGIAEALVEISVVEVNDVPVATDDTYQTNAGEALIINDVSLGLIANDSDAEFDEQEKFVQLSVSLLSPPDSGELVLAENGTFTYTPASDFFGDVSFSYQLADPDGATAAANVAINVIDTAELPVVADDTYSIEEDVQLLVSAAEGVLTNDRDGGGSVLTASVLSPPQSGTLSLNSNGSFSYLGTENFNGTDSFTYLATNTSELTAEATVTINITPVNDAPEAVDDVFIIDESASGEITPLENDTDIDGDELRIVSASAELGTLTFTDTSISYEAPGTPGSDVITYTIADGDDLRATASISVTINDIEEAPIAEDDTASTNEDTPVSITPMDNDSDPDGDELTLSPDSASNGSIAVEGDILTFTPEENFNGIATVTYFITDPSGNMATGTITINVLPVNDAPEATDDEVEVAERQSVVFDPRINDTDIDEDALSIINAQSDSGEISFSTTEITYTAPGEPGQAVLTYTISDPEGATATATVLVTITNIDDLPVTQDDEANVDEDNSVVILPLENDTEPDGEALTVSVVSATNGTASADSDTTITFTPDNNFNGEAVINYLASDPGGNSTPGIITITVNPINDAPEAVDDQVTVAESSVSELTPLINDSDIDGDTLTITEVISSFGTAILNANSINYTAPDTPGQGTISYTISDPSGATASATISVNVSNIQDIPIALDDVASTNEDTPVEISPLSNDSDEDGDTLTVIIESVSSGTVLLFNNVITYTPAQNFNGTATIVYAASDTAGNRDTATISITVVPINDAPIALDDTSTTNEDTAVQITPLSNDSDADNDALTVSILSVSTGVASVLDNVVTYTPAENFTGTATINYQIADPSNSTSTAIITINVVGVNDAPVAQNDTATTNEDTSVQINPLSNDSDADNDVLTVSILSVSTGVASVLDNVVTYTPADNFNGTATINYQIADPSNTTSTATITITVVAVNDAPVAQNDNATTNEDTAVQINPLNNDSDTDNDALTVSILSVSTGVASVLNNVVTYTPAENFTGTATINYQISDPSNSTSTAIITINVVGVNDAPVAQNDTATTNEDTSVQINPLSNDSDADNDALTVSILSVSTGVASVLDNVVTYTPADNFNGTATINYQIADPSNTTSTATITITVVAVNDAPVAQNDTATTNEDTSVQINPLNNDSDADNDALTVSILSVSTGVASVLDNVVTYTPADNFNGTATINYQIADTSNTTSTATIAINVAAVNDAPVVVNDTATVAKNGTVTISPLGNDTDVDGDNLTITSAVPTSGVVTISSDATTLAFSPASGFAGTVTITYTVTDGTASVNGTVTVTVTNNAPVAVDDTYSVNAGETASLAVLSNDTDANNDTLSITQATATQGSVTISTNANSLSYTAPADTTTTDTINYTISDPSGATSTATATISVTEQAFNGEFDPDGDGTSDVTATANGSTYTVTFGTNVGAVYYNDNGSTVSVTTNDAGAHELTIQGTATPNRPAVLPQNNLVNFGEGTTQASNHILPSATNQVKFTINGNEHGFTVSNLNQANANVAFIPPTPLNSGFQSQTSFDFYLRYPSFTGPVRLGLDNGEHYRFNDDGTGNVRGTDFDLNVTWQETSTKLILTALNDVESPEFISVYHLDNDNSDGRALNVITRAEADAYVAATNTTLVQVFTKEAREVLTFVRDHQLFIDARSERFLTYRIDSTANPTITSANNGVTSAVPAETLDVELWDISQLKVHPISYSDIQGGIATYVPKIVNNQYQDLIADTCLFSEASTGSNSGSGSCVFSSLSFTWSITNNILRIDFGNNILADYRWLDDLAFENTFSIEFTVGSGATQSGYSAYVYWLPLADITDAQVSTFVTGNYLDSALVKTNPGARLADGSIDTLELSGFYFANNGMAKNLDSITSFFGTEIIDTDRKWNITNGLITLESLSSVSSGNAFSSAFDQCTNSNDANCFIWQFRELFPIAIDGNKLWVWETLWQNQDGPELKGNVNYIEVIPPRIQFYELNSTIPGAPNSVNFNRPPLWKAIELTTDENTPLNSVSLISFFSDPESDTITLTQVGVDPGTGTATLNSDQTITFTPATGFVGKTNLYIDATDSVNEVFPAGVITVRSANQPPVAVNDTANAISGFASLITPLSNDTDGNNDSLTITAASANTGAVSINNNGTQLEFTPPNSFTGDATINYSISDGRGGTASATITVTVSLPVFSGSYDLDNSSVADFTITSSNGTFTVAFSSEVSAVYYTLNGQKFLLSRNPSGGFNFDYPPNTNPIPVLTYVINGVEYSFAPDDLSQTTPNLIYSGFTSLTNDFGTLSSYQLIGRAAPHNAALNTALENGVLYDLRNDGTGDYNSNLITDSVTWSQTANTVTVMLDNPVPGSGFVSIYDLDDDASTGQAYGLITKAQADAYVVATNGFDQVFALITTLGYDLTATRKQGYYYEVNRTFVQQLIISSAPVIGNIGPVNIAVPDTPSQLLSTAEFNFKPITAADIVGTIHLPVPVTDNADYFLNFASESCTLVETTTGSNSGTGTCGVNNQAATWSIGADGSIAATFGSTVNVIYRWLDSGTVENTFFVKVTDASNQTFTTLDFWLKPQALSTSQVSTIVSQGNYLEIDDVVTNPQLLSTPGTVAFFSVNGIYLGGSGLAKNIQQLSSPSVASPSSVVDVDLHWNIDANGNVNLAAQSNVSSGDTYKYRYSQCTNSNDQNCYQWEVRNWIPLAIDGNRIWVMESTTQDPDGGQAFDSTNGLEPFGDNNIRFYERTTTIPGSPNSISFNREPVLLSAGSLTAQSGVASTLNVLSLIGDPENDTLSILSAQGNGTATVNSDNSITFTPTFGLSGPTSLNFVVSDGINNVSMLVDVLVAPPNTPPVAVDDFEGAIGSHSYSYNVLANDFDDDGDPLTITALSNTTDFSIGNNGSTIEYTAPAINSPSSTSVIYTISDGNGGSFSATLNVSLSPNSNPVAVNDTAGPVTTGTAITISPLDNDTDVDGDTLTIQTVNSNIGSAVISNDSLTFNLTPSVGAGTYTISYVVSDGFGGTASANIDVTVVAANNAPVANPETVNVISGQSITIQPLLNDTDVDNDPLTIGGYMLIGQNNPTLAGSVTINAANNELTYNAPTLASQDNRFIRYYASDDKGANSNQTIITITVTPNSVPTDILIDGGNSDSIAANSTGTNAAVGVLTTTDADAGDSHSYNLVIASAANNCTSDAGNGNFNIDAATNTLRTITTLAANTYDVCIETFDGTNVFAKTLTITVTGPPNTPPVANPDTVNAVAGAPVDFTPLDNDSDADGDTLSVSAVSSMDGYISVLGDGVTLRFLAQPSWASGVFTVQYTADDGRGGTSSSTITINLADNPPIATNDAVTVAPLGFINIDVLANDTDPETNPLTIVSASASNGSANPSSDNLSIDYTAPSVSRSDTINYTIQDVAGNQASAQVSVTVNTSPSASASNETISTSSTMAFSPSFSDPDGDTTTITAASVTSGNTSGSVSSFSASDITFSSTAIAGTAVISYTVQDSFGGTASSTITVTVSNTNSAPTNILIDGFSSKSIAEYLVTSGATIGTLSTTDADGSDTHSYSLVAAGSSANGTCSSAADNSSFDIDGADLTVISSIPAANYNVCVQTSDGTTTFQKTIQVDVFTPNSAPTDVLIDGGNSDSIVSNLTGTNVVVGVLSSTDVDSGDSHTYDLVNTGASNNGNCSADTGNSSFNISGNNLRTKTSLSAAVYNLCVETSDGTESFQKTIPITVSAPNTAPSFTANPIAVSATINSSILVFIEDHTSDTNGDSVTVSTIDSVASGNATIVSSGKFIKYDATGTTGVHNVNFTITDGTDTTTGGVLQVTVSSATGNNPIAVNDTVTVPSGGSIVIYPLENDIDDGGASALTLSFVQANTIANATALMFDSLHAAPSMASIRSDNRSIDLDVSGLSTGSYTLQYIVADTNGNTDTGQITVNVAATNTAPTGVSDAYNISSGSLVSIDALGGVLANDTDSQNNTLNVSVASGPSQASSFALNPDGSFSYQHNGMAVFNDSFTYTVTDGALTHGPIAVTLSIQIDNFAPEICSPLPRYFEAGETFNFPIDIVDPDGGPSLSVTNPSGPSWLTVVNNSGDYSLQSNNPGVTPSTADVGTQTVTLQVSDGISTNSTSFDLTVFDHSSGNNPVDSNIVVGAKERIQDIAVDNKGRLVIVGHNETTGQGLVIRRNSDGSVDNSFDGDGSVGFDNTATVAHVDKPRGVAIRPDNSIVVVGGFEDGSGADSFIRVYKENGALDTTFSGDGIIQVDVGGNKDDRAYDVVVLDNGNVFVAIRSYNGTHWEITTHMYDVNGNLDSNFDTDGIHTYSHSGDDIWVTDAEVSNEGYIYLTGNIQNSGNNDMYVLRYNHSGLDTKFNGDDVNADGNDNGLYVVPAVGSNEGAVGWDLEFDADGDILIAGRIQLPGQDDFVVVKLNVTYDSGTQHYDVAMDNTFDSDGELIIDANTSHSVVANALVSDKRGNFYVVGVSSASIQETYIAKISSDGVLDSSYGSGGIKTLNSNSELDIETNATLGPDGQLIVVDTVDTAAEDTISIYYDYIVEPINFGTCGVNTITQTSDVITDMSHISSGNYYGVGHGIAQGGTYKETLIAKVTESGGMDSNFGDNGTVRILPGNDDYLAQKGAVTGDLGYVTAGTRTSTDNWFMVKVNSIGILESTFDGDGIRDVVASGTVDIRDLFINPSNQEIIVGFNNSNMMFVTGFTANGADNPSFFGEGSTNGSSPGSISASTFTNHTDTNFDLISLERSISSGNIYAMGQFNNGTYDSPALIEMASNGLIDTSLGTNGILHFDLGSDATLIDSATGTGTQVYMLARMSNDATIRVLRFNTTSETLDSTFGNNGIVTLPYRIDSLATSSSSIEATTDGKIWIQASHTTDGRQMIRLTDDGGVKTDYINGGQTKLAGGIAHWTNVKGFRITSNNNETLLFGQEDSNHGGTTTENFAFARMNATGVIAPNKPFFVDFSAAGYSFDIALDGYSRILLGGSLLVDNDGDGDVDDSISTARISNNGTGDTTWNSGSAFANYNTKIGYSDYAEAISITDEGSARISGKHFNTSTPSSTDVYQLKTQKGTSTGISTPEYNNGSLALTSSATTVHDQYLADDGSLYLVGSRNATGGFLAKVQPNGLLDGSFSSGNNAGVFDLQLEWNGTLGVNSALTGITPTSRGTLAVSGYYWDGSHYIAIVMEFLTNGTRVTDFNTTGHYGHVAGVNSFFYDITVGPDGQLYAVGSEETSGGSGDHDVLIVSLNHSIAGIPQNGSLNTSFPQNTTVTTYNGSGIFRYPLGTTTDRAIGVEKDPYGGLVLLTSTGSQHQLRRIDAVNSATLSNAITNFDLTSHDTTHEMLKMAIDSVGNIYITGFAKVDGRPKFYVVRYPNAVGPF